LLSGPNTRNNRVLTKNAKPVYNTDYSLPPSPSFMSIPSQTGVDIRVSFSGGSATAHDIEFFKNGVSQGTTTYQNASTEYFDIDDYGEWTIVFNEVVTARTTVTIYNYGVSLIDYIHTASLNTTNLPNATSFSIASSGWVKRRWEYSFPRDTSTIGQVKVLSLDSMSGLTYIDIDGNGIRELDITDCTVLEYVMAQNNNIKEISFTSSSLTGIDFDSNALTKIDISGQTNLESVYCSFCNLESIDLTNCSSIKYLDLQHNRLTELDTSDCTALLGIYCNNNYLTSIDFTANTSLTYIYAQYNLISSASVTNLTALYRLEIYNNKLVSLNVNGASSLQYLFVNNNLLTAPPTNLPSSMFTLRLEHNRITSLNLNLSNLLYLYAYNNKISSFSISNLPALNYLYLGSNLLTSINVASHSSLVILDLTDNLLTEAPSINSNLTGLYLEGNNITTFDYSTSSLSRFSISGEAITSVDGLLPSSMISLFLKNTGITTIDVSSYTHLTTLDLSNTPLTSLDMSSITTPSAIVLYINNTPSLASVTFSSKMYILECRNTGLSSLDLAGTQVYSLDCRHNSFSSLILNTAYYAFNGYVLLYCSDCSLTSITNHAIATSKITAAYYRDNNFSQATVDAILTELDNATVTSQVEYDTANPYQHVYPTVSHIDLRGPNMAEPSATGLAYKASLEAKGYRVFVNGSI